MIVDADLAPGEQLAQSTHAAFAFSQQFPAETRAWHDASNFLVVLASPELPALQARLDVPHVCVFEPDYGGALTAVAIPPGLAPAWLSSLPLALKRAAMA